MIRRTVYFSGRVQGVGFRYTTCLVAERFQVVGFVRNLRDGRVEAVIEGEAKEVDQFVGAVGLEMGDFIRDIQSHDDSATGEFRDFDVRH